jgi:hypothetical protein
MRLLLLLLPSAAAYRRPAYSAAAQSPIVFICDGNADRDPDNNGCPDSDARRNNYRNAHGNAYGHPIGHGAILLSDIAAGREILKDDIQIIF